jgi:hypothetical protein
MANARNYGLLKSYAVNGADYSPLVHFMLGDSKSLLGKKLGSNFID